MSSATMLVVMTTTLLQISGHPQCLDFRPPFEAETGLSLCVTYTDFGCCTGADDAALGQTYDRLKARLEPQVWARCHGYIQDILCQSCSPYSAHIFDAERTMAARSFPGLCANYCLEFWRDCHDVIIFLDPSLNQSSMLHEDDVFCQHVALTDVDYCYPHLLTNPVLNGQIQHQSQTRDGCLCLETMATNLSSALWARHAGDGTGRLFVVEQQGVVKVILPATKRVLRVPFLNITRRVKVGRWAGDERGLLGLAFHPRYSSNGRFFLYYTRSKPANYSTPDDFLSMGISRIDHIVRISEMRVSRNNPNRADHGYEKILLEIPQPYPNHNGGELLFLDDGYLYIFVGDGGGAGDPFNVAQNRSSLLGKVLRLDVDSNPDRPYSIPCENPFLGHTGARPEIFALGVRNIWRCGVDPGDEITGSGRGRVLCGDVGQNAYEEVNVLKAGVNYGWRLKEGSACYLDACNHTAMEKEELPVHTYHHAVGKSVTGGHFYRGCQSPALSGLYIYGDYVSGRLFSLEQNSEGNWTNKDVTLCGDDVCFNGLTNKHDIHILSFGQDRDGEVYMLTTPSSRPRRPDSKIFKLIDPLRRGNPVECATRHRHEDHSRLHHGVTARGPAIVDVVVRRICGVGQGPPCPVSARLRHLQDPNSFNQP